jgi:hypothetical protein
MAIVSPHLQHRATAVPRFFSDLACPLQPSEDQWDTARGCLAEFIGLALFQFFGGLQSAGPAGNGVVLAVLIYCTAAISGGHLNPAVTGALALTKQIP